MLSNVTWDHSTAMLEIKNLSLCYGEAYALSNVNLRVEKGSWVSIIGSNGAGKTSIIRTITGILKCKEGDILFDGHNITDLSAYDICSLGLGHVAEGRQIFPTMSVGDNLDLGAVGGKPWWKAKKSVIEPKKEEIFALFPRLKERVDQQAGTLSGGEQQMLAIGRCLMNNPTMILMDEPSLGLSPLMVDEMFHLINQLNKKGITILLVEQNVNLSLKYADYAYVLETGSIVKEGNEQDLLSDKNIKEIYLGI